MGVMGHIVLRIYPDGRVERSESARSWRERRELLGFALFLQPGLAALDVSARLWQDLRPAVPDTERDGAL
jgi:hypothetical protein